MLHLRIQLKNAGNKTEIEAQAKIDRIKIMASEKTIKDHDFIVIENICMSKILYNKISLMNLILLLVICLTIVTVNS
jgi:hypothetical protein